MRISRQRPRPQRFHDADLPHLLGHNRGDSVADQEAAEDDAEDRKGGQQLEEGRQFAPPIGVLGVADDAEADADATRTEDAADAPGGGVGLVGGFEAEEEAIVADEVRFFAHVGDRGRRRTPG